jgi:hypothetical protein
MPFYTRAFKRGTSSFIGLTDVPESYDGQSLKYVRVNETEDGLEFVNSPSEADTLQTVTDRGATTTNDITAKSFIKTGGLSSEFLKADGSSDSNDYLNLNQTNPQLKIYYVDADNGNDSNTGLTPSLAWKTIAKVNASAFLPGERILFKRGCEWREKLTIPSSGSAQLPLIFSSYGTGNNPLINGSKLLDTTDFIEQNISKSILQEIELTSSTSDGATRNYREVITSQEDSTTVKIRLRASEDGDLVIGGSSFGPRTTGNKSSGMVKVTWEGGG